MKSREIREKFLKYFESKGHQIHPSSSLVPDDPTMLLTTAGMVQFKPFFEGKEIPKNKRATSVQKCARTTDIDRVGRTARHLTFFEMLGNFSFGDYYKKEAIKWAWDLLTNHFKLDKKKLWATIFTDDDEAYSIWKKDTSIDKDKIARLGEEHNFWSAGETGPCGPSSEIIYDFGPEFACGDNCVIGCDCDRWLEIWNLVFMQFERNEDRSLVELPNKNIDTGMGLERIASILQNVEDNFHTDGIKPILDVVAKAAGIKVGDNEKSDVSLKIIADHCRATAFLISDGVMPSNEGRGYVLRRLIRRSIRHGWLLGINKPFLKNPIEVVIKEMGIYYNELVNNREYIEKIVFTEEEKFGHTLRQGLQIINEQLGDLKKSMNNELSGEIIFNLHDTFGFPVELTAEIAEENKINLDMKQFEKLMKEQRKRAREAWKEDEIEHSPIYNKLLNVVGTTDFRGYSDMETEAEIKAIIVNGKSIKETTKEKEVELVLDKTPFYAEKGGQIADTGIISGKSSQAKVIDTKEAAAGLVVHKVSIDKGKFKVGENVLASINRNKRLAIMRAHSAAHILHWALREYFGNHIKQAGSFVEDDRLRFDFTHFEALTGNQLNEIEKMVNEKILMSLPVKTFTTTIDYAREIKAVALFNEKYGDFVRVVEAGDFSKELCGGTHVTNTAFINLFKIKSEGSVGANVRRIEALTGSRVLAKLVEDEKLLQDVSTILNIDNVRILSKIESINTENIALRKELKKSTKGDSVLRIDELIKKVITINGFNVAIASIENADMNLLRNYSDLLRDKLGKSVIMLASSQKSKVFLIAAASKDAVAAGFDANLWLKDVVSLIGGSGGGKAGLAQAGGKKIDGIEKALDKALQYVRLKTK